jgi:hypothetical protein
MVRLNHISAVLLLLPQCCWSFLPSSSRSHSRSSPFVSSQSQSAFTHLHQAATSISIDASDVLAVPEQPPVSLSAIDNPKVGVLLLNLGGPETGDDVEGTYLTLIDRQRLFGNESENKGYSMH